MSATAAIDERIQELVEQHRDQLAELVDQALERELATLVVERIAARNGAAHKPTQAPSARAEAATKACNRCARDLPVKAFDRHRNTCRRCRQEQQREREQRARAQEPPHPPDGAEGD